MQARRTQCDTSNEVALWCPSVRECRLKSDALRLTICEVDGEEPVRAIETLELHLATLGELDS
jgi:hypothetical protein